MTPDLVSLCVCPACRGDLTEAAGGLQCAACRETYDIVDGIPILLPKHPEGTEEAYRENYNSIARDDLAKPIVPNRSGLLHEPLMEFVGDVAGKSILDIGAANGLYLARLCAGRKVAVDLALPYLRMIQPDSGILPICGDAEYLPVKVRLFDVIIVSDVLEHLLHPERLVTLLWRECRADARIIVHIPWEESLTPYRSVPYQFVHLRSFRSYSFRVLFNAFSVRREKNSLPLLTDPLVFQLERFLPRKLFDALVYAYFYTDLKKIEYAHRAVWIRELPRREWWLLRLYRPQVKMFELRKHRSTYRLARLAERATAAWWRGLERAGGATAGSGEVGPCDAPPSAASAAAVDPPGRTLTRARNILEMVWARRRWEASVPRGAPRSGSCCDAPPGEDGEGLGKSGGPPQDYGGAGTRR